LWILACNEKSVSLHCKFEESTCCLQFWLNYHVSLRHYIDSIRVLLQVYISLSLLQLSKVHCCEEETPPK
jgi:hypothetical protein